MSSIKSIILVASTLLFLLPGIAHSLNLFDYSSKLFESNQKSDLHKIDNDKKHQRREQIKRDEDHRNADTQRKLLEQRLLDRRDSQRSSNVEQKRLADQRRLERQREIELESSLQHERRNSEEKTLSTGLFHTCAITYRAGVEDTCAEHPCGPARCWGHNDRGEASPPPGAMFEQLSAGGFFTCALKPGGKVVCWGAIDHPPKSLESLSSEELSNFNHARRMQQQAGGWRDNTRVNGDDYYVQVSSGMKHACAITRGQTVHCWGSNHYGESSPPAEEKFVQVSAGNSFTCGIRPNGRAICWGRNDMGQCSPPPYPVAFQQISTSLGGDHACGVLADGEGISCWGNNGRGQSEDQDGRFVQVSAGTRTSCAVKVEDSELDTDNGSTPTSIHCWGSRANALLDHFDGRDRSKAKKGEHKQISLGQDHACATTMKVDESNNDGSTKTALECWWLAGSDFDAHKVPLGHVQIG